MLFLDAFRLTVSNYKSEQIVLQQVIVIASEACIQPSTSRFPYQYGMLRTMTTDNGDNSMTSRISI